jgi:hypothetical protein
MTPLPRLPRLLRAFSIIFIGFPGAIFWLLGALSSVGTVAFFLQPQPDTSYFSLSRLLGISLDALAMIVGYLMVIGNRTLCDDPRDRHTVGHLPERVLWGLAVQGCGTLVAGAGVVIVLYTFSGNWEHLILPMLILSTFSLGWHFCDRQRSKLHQSWRQELLELEAARAQLELVPQAPRES